MPYNDRKPKEMIEDQIRHRIRFPENLVSSDARDLIRHMVHPRRELRATTADILASRWLQGCRYFASLFCVSFSIFFVEAISCEV